MVWYFFVVHPFQSFVFDNRPNSFDLTSNVRQYALLFSCSKTIPRLSISEHFLFQRKTTITHSFDHHIILSYCFNRHVGFQVFSLASHSRYCKMGNFRGQEKFTKISPHVNYACNDYQKTYECMNRSKRRYGVNVDEITTHNHTNK